MPSPRSTCLLTNAQRGLAGRIDSDLELEIDHFTGLDSETGLVPPQAEIAETAHSSAQPVLSSPDLQGLVFVVSKAADLQAVDRSLYDGQGAQIVASIDVDTTAMLGGCRGPFEGRAWRWAEAAGGHLTVKSVPGQGTRVQVTVPRPHPDRQPMSLLKQIIARAGKLFRFNKAPTQTSR